MCLLFLTYLFKLYFMSLDNRHWTILRGQKSSQGRCLSQVLAGETTMLRVQFFLQWDPQMSWYHSSCLKEINCCSKISLLRYVLVHLLQWAKPKSTCISAYHKFLLLLNIHIFSYCIIVSVGAASDRLVPARNMCPFPTKEPHPLRPVQVSSWAHLKF